MANEFDEINLNELPDQQEAQNVSQPDFENVNLDELPDQQDQTLKSALYLANRSNPETKVQAFNLAKKMSLPTDSIDFVERNYSDLKLRSDDSIVDFDTMIRKFPKTSSFLSNPTNATIAKDDHKALTSAEDRFKEYGFFNEWYDRAHAGIADLQANIAKVPGALGEGSLIFSNATRKSLGLDQVSVPKEWINNDTAKLYTKLAEETRKKYEDLDGSIYEELFEKGDVAKAGRLAFMQFTESLPTTAFVMVAGTATSLAGAGAAAAAGVGGVAAGLLTMAQSLGETIEQPEVEPLAGQVSAISKGALEGLIEQLQVLGPLKHWDKALEKAGRSLVRKEFWKEFGKAWFYSGATEGTTEALTQAGQDFSDYMTGVNPDLTFVQSFQNAFNAGVVGAMGGLSTTSVQTSLMAYQRQQLVRQTALARDFYLAIGEDAKASLARERLPESWKEHVDGIVEEGRVKEIYIDVEDFKTYAQKQNIDPTKLAQELGIVEEVSRAEETDSSISVPLSKWTAENVTSEHYVGLSNDIRVREEGLSYNQAKKQEAEIQAELEKEKQEAEKQESLKSVQAKESREIGKQIESQLVGAGYKKEEAKTVAKVQESFFKAFVGERAKKSVKDFFSKYNLTYSRGDESVDLKPGMIAETKDLTPEFSDEEIRVLEQSGIEVKRIPGTNVVDASAMFSLKKPIKQEAVSEPDIGKRLTKKELDEYNNRIDEIDELLDSPDLTDQEDSSLRSELDNIIKILETSQRLAESEEALLKSKKKKKGRKKKQSELEKYLEDPNQQALDDDSKQKLLGIEARFGEKSNKISKALVDAQGSDKQPYAKQTPDTIIPIPNFESKQSTIGAPGIAEYGRGKNVEQLPWADSKYGATKLLIQKLASLGEKITINTSQDLIARDDYMELLPKDTEINIWASTKDDEANRRIFPGNASRLRQETAYAKLKEAGFNVKLKEPTVDSIIEAAGIGQIRKSTGWDSENVIRKELAKVVRPEFKVLKQSAIGFYSKLQRTIEEKLPNKTSVEQLRSTIKEVKSDEIKWSGIDEFLKGKKTVNKEELLDFLRLNEIAIQEVEKGGEKAIIKQGDTVYAIFNSTGEFYSAFRDQDNAASEISRLIEEEGYDAQEFHIQDMEWDGGLTLEDIENDLFFESHTGPAEYSDYVLPGRSDNYKEILFTLPAIEKQEELPEGFRVVDRGEDFFASASRFIVLGPTEGVGTIDGEGRYSSGPTEESAISNYFLYHKKGEPVFKSPHFKEENVLAHARIDERKTKSGEEVLFVNEIQSDWAQKGRKSGFSVDLKKAQDEFERYSKELADKYDLNPLQNLAMYAKIKKMEQSEVDKYESLQKEWLKHKGTVPDMPFSKTWHEFVFKRLIREAAKKGFSRLAWITGEQAAELYDISKRVDKIIYNKNTETIIVYSSGDNVLRKKVSIEELPSLIGKDLSQKINDSKYTSVFLEGLDLTMGGEGMKGFYDKIIYDYAKKFGKKFGAKVSSIEIEGVHRATPPTIVHSIEITQELKDAALGEGFELFQKSDEGPRGLIKIGNQSMDIKLFSNADITTPIHEFAHFSLEVMGDLSEDIEVPQDVKDDYKKVLNFLGIEDRSQIETKHHEMFADAMETYFLEGNSPSEGLRSVFNRLKDWFQSIYEYVKGGEGVHGVKLNDEIREVFDRMFATEAEILKNMPKPMFPDPASVGMNPSQVDKYLKAQEEATIFAKDNLRQKIAKDLKRKQRAEYKARKSQIVPEWEEKANRNPVYMVLSVLQSGVMPDGTELSPEMKGIKLDKEALEFEFGEDILKVLPKDTYEENGVYHGIMAEAFGFKSPTDMIDQISTSPSKKEYIDSNVNAQLDQEFPPIDPQQISADIIDSVYNEKLMDMKQLELEYLMTNNPNLVKKITKKVVARPLNKQYINQQAEKIINETLMTQVKPHLYDRAARASAKKAGELLASGDIAGAFEAKRKEQLNIALYKKSMEALKTKESVKDTVKKFLKKDADLAKTRDMDLIDAGRKIIAHYNLSSVKSLKEDPLANLRAYDPDMYEHVNGLVNGVIKTGKTFEQLTFAEFFDINTALKALWATSRAEKQITIEGKKIDLYEAIRAMDGRVAELNIDPKEYKRKRKQTFLEEKYTTLLEMNAALTRVEAWVESIDKDFFGPFRKYIWNPINDALTKYRDEKNRVFQRYEREILAKYQDLFDKKTDINAYEIGESFSPVELIMVILHSGNMSNKDKLIRGYRWGSIDEITGQISHSNFDAFFNRAMKEGIITERHLDLAQEIWDLLESFKADTQRAHKEIYGHYFDEITANEIQTPWGKTYRGGYIPAIADPLQDDQVAIRKAKNELEETSIATAFPSTGRGATMKRVQAYAAPLSLNMNILSAHIDWALRFTHVQPAIKDVSKIVMNREFRDSIKLIDENAVKDILLPWLQRAATQKVMSPDRFRFVDKIARNLRNSASMQIMVLSFSNGLQQLTGIFPAMVKVGPKHILKGIRQFTLNPIETNKLINELSPWMRSTANSSFYETQNAISEIVVEKDLSGKFKNFQEISKKYGYIFSQAFQGFVNNASWIGAFNKSIEEGFSQEQAVKFADSVVRLTQGSSTAENISNFETGSPSALLFKQFVSYFNMLYNLQSSQYKKIMRDSATPYKAPQLVYVYALAHAIPAILSDAVFKAVGRGYSSDDDEEFTDQIIDTLFFSQVRTFVAMAPYGQAANVVFNGFNNSRYDDRINMSPGMQMAESLFQSPGILYKKISEDEEFTDQDYRTFANSLGYLLGLPITPIYRRAEYIYKVMDNQLEVEATPLEITRGILTGKEQKQ